MLKDPISAGVLGLTVVGKWGGVTERTCRQVMEAWARWKPNLPSLRLDLKPAPIMVVVRDTACVFKQPLCVLGEKALISLTQGRK